MSHSRKIKLVKESGGHSDAEVMLRDTANELLVFCAFDKHGYCRSTCASFGIEGQISEIVCLRLGGAIGILKP